MHKSVFWAGCEALTLSNTGNAPSGSLGTGTALPPNRYLSAKSLFAAPEHPDYVGESGKTADHGGPSRRVDGISRSDRNGGCPVSAVG